VRTGEDAGDDALAPGDIGEPTGTVGARVGLATGFAEGFGVGVSTVVVMGVKVSGVVASATELNLYWE
jgi:hypothetical protein